MPLYNIPYGPPQAADKAALMAGYYLPDPRRNHSGDCRGARTARPAGSSHAPGDIAFANAP